MNSIVRVVATVLTAAAVLSGPALPAAAAPAGEPAGNGTSVDAGSPAPRASLPELEGEVMCPTCGTLLELSRAPAAERERAFIRRLISEGKSEDEIKDALVAEYGPGALALPDDDGINFWAYVLPLLIFSMALAAVIFAVISWRRNRGGTGGNDPEPVTPGGDDEDRLERDMARFDL